MVFDMTDPYCTLVLRGIENTLYQSSYLPILTDVHNERSRFERYLEMLLDRRVEGSLCWPTGFSWISMCSPIWRRAAFRRR
jgi:DNA-binding LacI/PurR family transcriptional regulator